MSTIQDVKNYRRYTLKEISRLMVKNKSTMLYILIIVLLGTISGIVTRYFMSAVLDQAIQGSLGSILDVLVVLTVMRFVGLRLEMWKVYLIVNKVAYELQHEYEMEILYHLSKLDQAYYTSMSRAKLMTRMKSIRNVVGIIEEALWTVIPSIAQILLTIIPFIFILPSAIPVVIIVFVIFIWLDKIMLDGQYPLKKERKKLEEEQDQRILRIVEGNSTLKSAGTINRQIQEYDEQYRLLKIVGMKELKKVLRGPGIMRDVDLHLGRLMVLALAIWIFHGGSIEVQTLLFASSLSDSMFVNFWSVVRWNYRLQYESETIQKLYNLRMQKASRTEPSTKEAVQICSDERVRFNLQNVYFKYKPFPFFGDDAEELTVVGSSDKHQIENVSLEISDGESIALVGPSGSGKSTLVRILQGHYEVDEGIVMINGKDIRKIPSENLSELFSVVHQGNEVVVFNHSIRFNVTCGADCPDEDVISALKQAMLWETIQEMGGLDTIVGEKGLKLSGGQRQRLAIARAILMNSRVVILDEATSALDSHTEKFIQDSLNALMEGRTAIVIAHRLSTIRYVDRIAVLDRGQIVELGSWDELMRIQDGLFKSLVESQSL